MRSALAVVVLGLALGLVLGGLMWSVVLSGAGS